MAEIVEEEDADFGVFNTAEEDNKPLENGNHHGQGRSFDDNDDSFGDFAASPLGQQEEKIKVENEHASDNQGQGSESYFVNDDFGEFGSASSPPAPAVDDETNKYPDDKINFDSTDDQEVGNAHPASEDNSKNLDTEEPSSESVIPDETPHKNNIVGIDDDDDDFGDFENGQPTTATGNAEPVSELIPENVNENQKNCSHDDDGDDFGDFGSADPTTGSKNVQLHAVGEPLKNENPQEKNGDIDDDDFGDFGIAEPTTAQTTATKLEEEAEFRTFGSADPHSGGSTKEEKTNLNGTDENDFDGFDSAVVGGILFPSEDDGSGPAGYDTAKKAQTSNGDDSFENFDDFLSTNITKEVEKPGDSNDEFGALGGPSSDRAVIESKPSEDSFGDFNEISSSPNGTKSVENTSAVDSSTTEDLFGDFNEVSPPTNQSTTDDDDADDDFGDFDSAPAYEATTPKQTDGGSLGDFSSFNQTTSSESEISSSASQNAGFNANLASQPQHAQTAEDTDPVLQKARTVVSRVFEQHVKSEPCDDSDSAIITAAVAELISSSGEDTKAETIDDPMVKLQDVLDEIKKEACPSLFIVSSKGDQYNPNEQFSIGIGEDPAFGDHGLETERVSSGTADCVAMLERDTKNPSKEAHQKPAATGSATATKDENRSSDKEVELLRKIPDLSFMLQPKLTLVPIKYK